MNILNFAIEFPDEDTCLLKFKEQRDYIVQYLKYFQDLNFSVVTNPTKRGERSKTLVPRVFVTE